MRTATRAAQAQNTVAAGRGLAIDTSFVLFFLAVEFGRTVSVINLDNIVLFSTLLMVAVLPYFLIGDEKSGFGNWLLGRFLIAGFAILLGVMFNQSLGTVLPDAFRFMPMTLLIVSAMLSCYIQFYGFLKLRLIK